jgi:tRNA(Ile2) C34 agmatinyltransferase TiaS
MPNKMTTIEAIEAMVFYKQKLYNGIYNEYISAFDNAISALDKQRPMKLDVYDDDCRADCPMCGRAFENNVNEWGCKYCPDCGQTLDWGDIE